MKKLKLSTITKLLKKENFTCNEIKEDDTIIHFYHLPHYAGSLIISLDLPKGQIIAKARLRFKGNVHINSYYIHPATKREFYKIIDDIKETYSDLSGTRF